MAQLYTLSPLINLNHIFEIYKWHTGVHCLGNFKQKKFSVNTKEITTSSRQFRLLPINSVCEKNASSLTHHTSHCMEETERNVARSNMRVAFISTEDRAGKKERDGYKVRHRIAY